MTECAAIREIGIWRGIRCFPILFLWRVKKEEKQFLQGVCGISHNLGMSKGYIQNGQTCVTEGPLQGREKLIRKIDRHKRLARLIIPGRNAFGDSNLEICAGLEIVSKS